MDLYGKLIFSKQKGNGHRAVYRTSFVAEAYADIILADLDAVDLVLFFERRVGREGYESITLGEDYSFVKACQRLGAELCHITVI